MRVFFLTLIVVTATAIGISQDYRLRVRHFTMQDGLPNDFVHSTTQDKDGFIWISTSYGYARFDGYKMDVFNQGRYTSHQPSTYNNARLIFSDKNDKIWISYFTNFTNSESQDRLIEILDPLHRDVSSFDQAFEKMAPFKMNDINGILSDPGFGICIFTANGSVYRYDGHFNKVGNMPTDALDKPLELLTTISNKAVWLLDNTKHILYEIEKEGKIRTSKTSKPIALICTDRLGQLWMFSDHLSKSWRKQIGKPIEMIKLLEEYPVFKKGIARKDVIDKKGRLWCIKGHEVFIFNSNGKLLFHTTFGDIEENYSNYNYSKQIQIDQAGNAWVSTPNGVYMLSLYESPFTNYMTDKGIQDIRGIVVDENNHIYINQLYLYQVDQRERVIANFQGIGSIKDDNIIWSGCYTAIPSVMKYDIQTQKATRITIDSSLIPDKGSVNIPYKSKKTSRIWLGGIKVLGYLKKEDKNITLFNNYGKFPELKSKTVNWIYENKEGLWLASSGGLYLLDESNDQIKEFFPLLANLNILHIYEDSKGIFWLATRGNGLWRWDRQTGAVTSFTQNDGLSNNVIYAVYEDEYGYFWMPSNYGLMRFNKTTHEVNTYLPKDGIPHQEFNSTSHIRTADGRFFFGGLGGVTSFYPKDFLDHKNNNAPLRITNFKKLNAKNGILYDYTENLLRDQEIVLNPGERSLTLEVALLNYESPEENRYAYRIEGLEKKWNYVNTNSIWIGQLPYGHYTFHIKAQDANKHWSKQEISIPVWVKMPFYRQWWFLLLIGLSFLSLIILGVRWRINQLQKNQEYLQAEVARQTVQIREQAEKLQALDEQKSRFFLNIAHELRTPLTLISSPIDLFLQKEKVDSNISVFLQSIRKNAQHLLSLVESMLDLGRLDAKHLKLIEQPVHFQSLTHRIFEMYESYAKLHEIAYYFHYQANDQLVLLLDISKFEKILHNLLSNAVKFTSSGGLVEMSVEEKEAEIHISVSDTGVGIAQEELPNVFERYFQAKSSSRVSGGTGIGLNIAQEYAQLMQGTLHVESTPYKGSRFSFHFPKKEAAAEVVIHQENESNKLIENTPAKNGKNKSQTILLVEDNEALQELLWQIVSPDYKIIQAANGIAALEILEKEKIHGIITDLMMPQMDGFEMIEEIKASDRLRHIPIIVITARANELDKLQALRIGVDDYLYKPFSPLELQARLHNLLSNKQRHIALNTTLEATDTPNADQQWLIELETKALELLKQKPDFKSNDIAFGMNISEVHLRRKIRSITGLSANDYIKEIRLQRARQLLEHKKMSNVAAIAYAVGFTTPRYFTELYIARFGKKPSSYLWNEYRNL